MKTFHIHIKGQVQGVGFRPHVSHLAKRYHLPGRVSNGVDGVHIYLSGDRFIVDQFYRELISNPPRNAQIRSSTTKEIDIREYSNFRIDTSNKKGKVDVLLTPDIGLCDACRKDLLDATNRRRNYAFTACLHCGPRYSIIKSLPYDRERTTMDNFIMCNNCDHEYNNQEDRRFYSQTNSCPDCPVHLSWADHRGEILATEADKCVDAAVNALNDEKIVAVKGIGGMLLMTDATSEKGINEIRLRKNRPAKPFALLYANEEMLKQDVITTKQSLEAWHSNESPIVLFNLKTHPKSGICSDLIAPGLDAIGIMQPYAPVLELISRKFGNPLIATSGNLTNNPICYKDEDVVDDLGKIADYFLMNDREIVVSQDDSVMLFSEENNQKIILRRSRGLAPNFNPVKGISAPHKILATGALLKSAFAMLVDQTIYISQYLGNTISYDAQLNYIHVLRHLSGVFNYTPEYVVVDKHPEYFSTRLGRELAEKHNASLLEVQHHKAHFAAVLAENELIQSAEPVLGVIWDGTGYGDDGMIWGGEFFIYQDQNIHRLGHLDYFKQMAGDKMAREPRLSALAICEHVSAADNILKQKFNSNEWNLYKSYLNKEAVLQSSSIGRLFDGIASLLGICDIQSYEGEAAMRLQRAARNGFGISGNKIQPYRLTEFSPGEISSAVVRDMLQHIPVEIIAAKFHATLARQIRLYAEKQAIDKVAFSGGVFQNNLLVDLIIDEMKEDFELFFHHDLSPNDENIALGQLTMANLKMEERRRTKQLINTI